MLGVDACSTLACFEGWVFRVAVLHTRLLLALTHFLSIATQLPQRTSTSTGERIKLLGDTMKIIQQITMEPDWADTHIAYVSRCVRVVACVRRAGMKGAGQQPSITCAGACILGRGETQLAVFSRTQRLHTQLYPPCACEQHVVMSCCAMPCLHLSLYAPPK